MLQLGVISNVFLNIKKYQIQFNQLKSFIGNVSLIFILFSQMNCPKHPLVGSA